MKENYYKILKVKKNASISEIRKAYLELAKKYHPDINKSDTAEEKFKEIVEAYKILSNKLERSKYEKRIEFDIKLYINRHIFYGIYDINLLYEKPAIIKHGIDKWIENIFDSAIVENNKKFIWEF